MKRFLCIVLTFAALFSFTACGGKAEAELNLDWEYVTGLPEGFPKLCDKVTESVESFDSTGDKVTVGWNILGEDSFKEYTEKIEKWAGAEFGKANDGVKSLTITKDEKELTIKAKYDGDADGFKNDNGSYNCQASIVISSTATRAAKYTPIKWNQLVALPSGFPKLCDSVTTVDEVYGKKDNSFALYWNRLDKGDYDGYISKIESWLGAEFGKPAADGTRTVSAKLNGKDITVKAAYNEKATGNYLQGNKYDSQARIEIVTPAE